MNPLLHVVATLSTLATKCNNLLNVLSVCPVLLPSVVLTLNDKTFNQTALPQ